MLAPTPAHGQLVRDGFALSYRVDGLGPSPALVIGCARYDQRTMTGALGDLFRLHFVDHRGFAPGPDGPRDPAQVASLEVLLADMEAMRGELGLERFALIGHSGHASLALAYAKRYPARVSALLLLGAAPDNSDARRAASEAAFVRDAAPARLAKHQARMAALAAQIAADPSRRFVAYLRAAAAQSWFDADYDAGWLWEDVHLNMDIIDHMWGVIFRDLDVLESIERVTCPVLLVLGRHDYLTGPPSVWDAAAPKLPAWTIATLEQSAHTPQLEQPAQLAACVRRWLTAAR